MASIDYQQYINSLAPGNLALEQTHQVQSEQFTQVNRTCELKWWICWWRSRCWRLSAVRCGNEEDICRQRVSFSSAFTFLYLHLLRMFPQMRIRRSKNGMCFIKVLYFNVKKLITFFACQENVHPDFTSSVASARALSIFFIIRFFAVWWKRMHIPTLCTVLWVFRWSEDFTLDLTYIPFLVQCASHIISLTQKLYSIQRINKIDNSKIINFLNRRIGDITLEWCELWEYKVSHIQDKKSLD